MEKTYYLYLGYYMNLKVFYCTKDGNIYAADTIQKGSRITLTLFACISVVFYVMGRNMRLDTITFSVVPVLLLSIFTGIVMGMVYSFYTDKKNGEYFSAKKPIKIQGDKYWKPLLKEAKKVTWSYSMFRFVLLFLVLVEPFLFMAVKDVILLVSYFVIWFAFAVSILQFRVAKRRKIIRTLYKQMTISM